MSSLHPRGRKAPTDPLALQACARQGCATCMDALLRRHENLVHFLVQRQYRGSAGYRDLVQAGRIGLWRALQHFDPARGIPFATYARIAIQRHVWRAVALAQRQCPSPEVLAQVAADQAALVQADEDPCADPAVVFDQREQRRALLAAMQATCDQHSVRWEHALVAYGLDGYPARSLAEVGRRDGVTREQMRQYREQALAHLRVRLVTGPYLVLCDRDTRATYQRLQALTRKALRQLGHRPRARRRA
jgi:RNA polymerase sigma factor (sigma-70 family)